MKINIVGRQMNVYDDFKELVDKKLSKLDKYFKSQAHVEATVTMSTKRRMKSLEVTINAGGTLFRSEVEADNFRDALDRSIDHIEGQIRKNKTKLAKRMRENLMNLEEIPDSEEDVGDEDEKELIIRTKQFEFKPMTPEEAIMQMDLLGHEFYVFNDVTTGDTCVVYKRKDGAYGLIEPMK